MDIDNLKADLDAVFAQAKQDKRDADFYLRILAQAVLTHGSDGFLSVDYSRGDDAKEAMANCQFEFGNGGVRIVRPNGELCGGRKSALRFKPSEEHGSKPC